MEAGVRGVRNVMGFPEGEGGVGWRAARWVLEEGGGVVLEGGVGYGGGGRG